LKTLGTKFQRKMSEPQKIAILILCHVNVASACKRTRSAFNFIPSNVRQIKLTADRSADLVSAFNN
jgi:hypothetical protein